MRPRCCLRVPGVVGGGVMAMNKKEQAEFDAAKKAVIVARALNWSEPVEPNMPAPRHGEEITGYLPHAYCGTFLYARSSSIGHATSRDEMPKRTSTQNARSLYSTKLLALRAVRYQVELECAKKLADIDIQIAVEKAKP